MGMGVRFLFKIELVVSHDMSNTFHFFLYGHIFTYEEEKVEVGEGKREEGSMAREGHRGVVNP